MQQYSIIIICIMALVIIGVVVAIVLINKNKNKNTSIITTSNPTNDLTNVEKRELLFDENIPSINLSSMLPVVLDRKPENGKLMKVDNKNVIAEIDNYMANTVKVANSANAINQVSNVANNLVKVDIPVNDLYHITGDKVRFFVQENGKMAQNAIGTPVDLSGVQAANLVNVAMGAGSMVVGQYYMKTISEKMDTLKNGVDKISSFQDEEYKSKVLNIIRSIQEISDFKYEIMKEDEIRRQKIGELAVKKDKCLELLGQANIHINNAIKACKDYKDYESRINGLQEWFEFQNILSMALQEIATLEYVLYLGKMSRELSINSYEEFMQDTSEINKEFIEWHKDQQKRFDIKIDEGLKHRGGIQWFWKLINNEYEKIDDNTKYTIEQQMDLDIPMIEDKSDRFKDNVAIIKDGDEYYYLIENKNDENADEE